MKAIKVALILALISGLAWPIYAANDAGYIQAIGPQTIDAKSLPNNELQQKSLYIIIKREEHYVSFEDWINGKNYPAIVEEKSDEQKLREDWERALGYDIFMPYFKVDQIKEKIETKSVLKVKKIKGKAVIHKDEAKYIFSIKF